MEHLGFVILLIAAVTLSFAFSYLQHAAYSRTVRHVAIDHDRPGVVIVSGRGRGALRGCVVVLAVDVTRRAIIDARAMSGSTVVARFRPAPQLQGPMRSAKDRATSRWMSAALTEAESQFRDVTRNRSSAYRNHGPAAAASKGSRA